MGAACARSCERAIYDICDDDKEPEMCNPVGMHFLVPSGHASDDAYASAMFPAKDTAASIPTKESSENSTYIPSLWKPLYGSNTLCSTLTPRGTGRFAEVLFTPRGSIGEEFRTPRSARDQGEEFRTPCPSARNSPRPHDETTQDASDADEISYVGERLDSMKHGSGHLRTNGMTYDGAFWHDQKHGEGVICWDDGRQYRGQFQNGVFHGDGEMSWPDGRQYCGQYVVGRKHGEGTFSWNDGRRYSGQWLAGKRQGTGVYTNAKGVTLTAFWQNDQPVRWERVEDAHPEHGRPALEGDEAPRSEQTFQV